METLSTTTFTPLDSNVDTTFESNGVKVVVDNVSIDYLREATIDFINDPQHGAGFAVSSPNAKGKSHEHGSSESCGCGSSEGSSCSSDGGCGSGGGSCSCNN